MGQFSEFWSRLRLYWNRLVGRIQFRVVLYKRYSRYRRALSQSLFSLVVAVIGWSVANQSWSTPADFAGTATAAVGLLFAAFQFLSAARISNSMQPLDTRRIIVTKKRTSIIVIGRDGKQMEVPFDKMEPSKDEKLLGFFKIDGGNIINNTAFASDIISNGILESQSLKIREINEREKKYEYISNDDDVARDQLCSLAASALGDKRNTNDKKVAIRTPIRDWASGVAVHQVRYFDSELTNEAFRSDVVRKWRSDPRGPDEDLFCSPRKYFPYDRVGGNKIAVRSFPISGIANHIGITAVVVTSDMKPILMRQGKVNNIGSGMIVCCGSGSMDWSDLRKGDGDLMAAMKRAVAREIMEESNGSIVDKRGEDAYNYLIFNTLATGFFRWVDRCGKPEFTFVTKIDKKSDEIKADQFETFLLSEAAQLRIHRVDNIVGTFSNLQKLDERLNLSSYMALWRLDQILRLEESVQDAASRRVRAFLKLD